MGIVYRKEDKALQAGTEKVRLLRMVLPTVTEKQALLISTMNLLK